MNHKTALAITRVHKSIPSVIQTKSEEDGVCRAENIGTEHPVCTLPLNLEDDNIVLQLTVMCVSVFYITMQRNVQNDFSWFGGKELVCLHRDLASSNTLAKNWRVNLEPRFIPQYPISLMLLWLTINLMLSFKALVI